MNSTRLNNSGHLGEQIASRYLEDQGLTLIDKNHFCKFGEIDLVMKQHNTLVFIEVKTRKSIKFGTPLQYITVSKQQKVKRAAQHYLQKNKCRSDTLVRFDAIGITINRNTEPDIEWVQNAFYAEY